MSATRTVDDVMAEFEKLDGFGKVCSLHAAGCRSRGELRQYLSALCDDRLRETFDEMEDDNQSRAQFESMNPVKP